MGAMATNRLIGRTCRIPFLPTKYAASLGRKPSLGTRRAVSLCAAIELGQPVVKERYLLLYQE